MSDNWAPKDLGDQLRAGRPAPSSGLVNAIVARIPGRVEDHPRASLRLALAGALTVALVSAVAAVGGVGYASKQVGHAFSAVKSTSAVPAKSAGLQYVGSPRVMGFQPKAACINQRISITGSNFKETTSVTMGGIPARFEYKNDSGLSAWVPDGFSGGTISVTTPRGTGTSAKSLKLKSPGCHA